jgi:hypothetical protein
MTEEFIGEQGFVGFKYLSGYHGTLLSEPYEYGFSIANERRMPVLCHTWSGNPPASEFRKIAEKYPNLSLLAAHGGGNRHTYLEFAGMCKDQPNLFIEICGGLMCDLWLEDIVAVAGADRIIFGTDMVNLDPRNDLGRIVFADIPEDDRKRILAGNFKNILGKRKK